MASIRDAGVYTLTLLYTPGVHGPLCPSHSWEEATSTLGFLGIGMFSMEVFVYCGEVTIIIVHELIE
jgi:hypothetical protein